MLRFLTMSGNVSNNRLVVFRFNKPMNTKVCIIE